MSPSAPLTGAMAPVLAAWAASITKQGGTAMSEPIGVLDPVVFVRFCALLGYKAEEVAEVLTKQYEVEPGTALRISQAVLRQQQEADLAEQSAFLNEVAESARIRGVPFEELLAEVEEAGEAEYDEWLEALGYGDVDRPAPGEEV